MSIQDSKQTVKELAVALMEVVNALNVIGRSDEEMNEMLNRKANMERALADLQKSIHDASAESEKVITAKKAETESALKQFKRQITLAEQALADVRHQANVSRETMQQQFAQEKSELIQAKQAQAKRLDEQIAQKQKTLNEVNAAIEEGKRRFA